MAKPRTGLLIFLFFIYFVLLFLDLGLNIFGILIPSIGAGLESISEILIETLSAIIIIIMFTFGIKKK